jgi:spore coat protein U-like protein
VAETLTTYGVIPAGQNVQAGNYTDTVAYQVTF